MTLGYRLNMEQDQGKAEQEEKNLCVRLDELSVYSCFQNNGTHH